MQKYDLSSAWLPNLQFRIIHMRFPKFCENNCYKNLLVIFAQKLDLPSRKNVMLTLSLILRVHENVGCTWKWRSLIIFWRLCPVLPTKTAVLRTAKIFDERGSKQNIRLDMLTSWKWDFEFINFNRWNKRKFPWELLSHVPLKYQVFVRNNYFLMFQIQSTRFQFHQPTTY